MKTRSENKIASPFQKSLCTTVLAVAFGSIANSAAAAVTCERTVTADVVALDQPVVFNRLGAQNVNYMIYALKRDVVNAVSNVPLTRGGAATPGQVKLRPDKRPRPLTLRVAAGECLRVNFTNLLNPTANPNNHPIPEMISNNQVAGRYAGFQPHGLQLANSIADYATNVGKNAATMGDAQAGLAAPGETKSFTYYAEAEGAFMAYSYGQSVGGEASGGNVGVGLFGVVNVQPKRANFYRSQLSEEERRLASRGTTAQGAPILDYEARYPLDCAGGPDAPVTGDGVWCREGKAGLPIVNMLDGNKLVHSDINAMIVGPNADGSFPADTYPLESEGKRNPAYPNRLEAFREFTVVFHDEQATAQVFPKWFSDPVLSHTLHGVRDSFMINYGSGGIGSEIIANRLGVGPMHDCLSCAYEEFFLTAYTVGDIGMQVDVPANTGLELCDPKLNNCAAVGPKATQAFFPEDPSNVHHSYVGDFVKFRNLHAGPKEQHIFHLHNHQWLFNPNDDNSNYIDAQGIGPGSGYTYEVAFGGSGNRNRSPGDAIFHCHFYPHFAQGMWEMWRIHDVNETGTVLEVSGGNADRPGFHASPFGLQSGRPAVGARALPDGEILAGTPIPAVVPLPGKAMAPMPGRVTIKTKDANGDGFPESSQANVIDRDINPGFPFWVAGIEDAVGQRPTTPPMDMLSDAEAVAIQAEVAGNADHLFEYITPALAGGADGGLPRHALDGYAAGGVSVSAQNRLDMHKDVEVAKPIYYPETGTDLELAAMKFHAQRWHSSSALNRDGTTVAKNFETNGVKPVPSGVYADPCRNDNGGWLYSGSQHPFWDAQNGATNYGVPKFGADNPRVYKGANIQIDAVFNKAGYHYPQQRIITLWEDVMPTINKVRPPEPFVIRLNTFDCAKYLHSNLVPKEYQLDDYQVKTPTDIIGQHIHLPKWDLTTTDGSANGWNYEDGTLSPGAVVERINAINHYNELLPPSNRILSGREKNDGLGNLILKPEPHPTLGAGPNNDWLGSRVTIQRWFADPVYNAEGKDRGLGLIFTHDHYGPSTHQQVGLYATVLVEPTNSKWVHNETGEAMYTRDDGGPTSWQAAILEDSNNDGQFESGFREFYFEYSDFQHAYEKGVYVGVGADGQPLGKIAYDVNGNPIPPGGVGANGAAIAANDTFRYSINPSYRLSPAAGNVFPDILRFPPVCPGGVPRPCPEAITADDAGMLVVNYRNEPVGLRVYDPNKLGPDGKPGSQADGLGGDLGYALQTRIDRAIPAFNTVLGDTPYPPLTLGGVAGDPFTPTIRSYPGDLVKVKIQAGGHEHEHNATIHGVKWTQGGSSYGQSKTSGWRNAQNPGISEQFTFSTPLTTDLKLRAKDLADYAYSVDASQDGWWSGMWGILRAYNILQPNLITLPGNENVKPGRVANRDQFNGVCPIDAKPREYNVVAMTANELLGNDIKTQLVPNDSSATQHVGAPVNPNGGTLIYNPRKTKIRTLQVETPDGQILNLGGQAGPLHDPTALLYVNALDLEPIPGANGGRNCDDTLGQPGVTKAECKVRLKANAPVEPLVMRAAAGECLKVTLHNRLPAVVPDLAGYNTLLQVVNRDRLGAQGLTTFNNNLIRPSSHVGLHSQMFEYDVTDNDGVNVGLNPVQTIAPPTLVNGKLKQGKPISYVWYAGHITHQANADGSVNLVAHPVEFGGGNITPADKVKQGQKGLVGSTSVEPLGSNFDMSLAALTQVRNHQTTDATAKRGTRAQMDITKADNTVMRDVSMMIQKGLNLRFGDATAVPNLAAEGAGIPEDAHDSGQSAINYGTEPSWFRFGMPADAPFEKAGLGGIQNSHELFANTCCTNDGLAATTADANVGDPVTPVFTAKAGQDLRVRVLEPAGAGRGTTFALHGHVWQRDPYIAGAVPSQVQGRNKYGFYLGAQESVTPNSHFDVIPANGAGGKGAVLGDYLMFDQGSFGTTNGIWGILRVSAVTP